MDARWVLWVLLQGGVVESSRLERAGAAAKVGEIAPYVTLLPKTEGRKRTRAGHQSRRVGCYQEVKVACRRRENIERQPVRKSRTWA